MDPLWPLIARRVAQGLGARPGELILVRDSAGRFDALLEILLAIELAGATPLPYLTPPGYLQRLWDAAPRDYLAEWDRRRRPWSQEIDRVLTLGGIPDDFAARDPQAYALWRGAVGRLKEIEEQRNLPTLVVALPTEARAAQLGMALPELERLLLPALAADPAQLMDEIERVRAAADCRTLTVQTGAGCELRLERAGRPWLWDDGMIDEADLARGGVVSNLPAGSIYTTVIERATQGRIRLPRAGSATDVTLTFADGRISEITAAQGGESLRALFERHTGEPRRVSHIGVGLNPHLARPLGWTLVDEHIHGCLFIAFGENRYMGGQNASSLNVDYVVPEATLLADGRAVVEAGRVV